MNIRKVFFAVAAMAVVACGQTPEEKLQAYEEAHEAMMSEYSMMMDSLATNPQAQEEFYNDFVERYIDFNLTSAKKNSDNEVSIKGLMNLRGLIEDEQVDEVISKMSEEMKTNEMVVRLKQGLDARKATAEGQMFVDFTVEHIYGFDRSMDPQPLKQEVKFSDYVGNGKYVLVDFWSPWCGPCRREMPNIKQVYDKYKGDDFNVLSIAVWERQPVTVTIETAAKLEMTWDQMNNAQSIPTELYGVEAIPHIMLIGPDGTILKRGLHGAEIEEVVAEFLSK